ncbi:MAG: sensor histidine kinase [Bacteriovoracaceae bacterium]
MLSRLANRLLETHLYLIEICSRGDQQEEDYIKTGFVVTCLYMWIVQTIYCGLIGLYAISFFCFTSFALQSIILFLNKRKYLSKNTSYNVIILLTVMGLQSSYINAGANINPTIIWLTAIPIISVTLLGIRYGGLWSLASALFSIVVMELVKRQGIQLNDWSDWHIYNVGQSNLFTGPLLFFMMFGFYSYNRKKLQSKITIQAKELELEKSEKEKLLTVLFHDLGRNTSLLSGYLELSGQKALDQKSKEKVYQLSEEIKSILQNAMDLDTQKVEAKKESVLMSDSFKLLRDKYESKLVEKNLSFVMDSSSDLSLNVNRSQFNNQILGNLISNAIKFSSPNSEITLRAQKCEGKILISIENAGIGYTDDSIKEGTLGEKGAGQGLKIVQEFSKLNGFSFEIKQDGDVTKACLTSN